MTTEEMKDLLAQREEATARLEGLIADEEQMKAFVAMLGQNSLSNISVHTALPTGEAVVVNIVDGSGSKHRFASFEADGGAILQAMLTAGLSHIETALAQRKSEVLALL